MSHNNLKLPQHVSYTYNVLPQHVSYTYNVTCNTMLLLLKKSSIGVLYRRVLRNDRVKVKMWGNEWVVFLLKSIIKW